MTITIGFIYRVLAGIGVSIGADAGLVGVPPVGGDEMGQRRVVISRIQEQEARLFVIALARRAIVGAASSARVNRPPHKSSL